MNYKGVAELTGLNTKTVRYLEREKVIVNDLTEENLIFMQTLQKIWGKPEFIKLLAADHNPAARARIIFSSGYNKLESYIMHRWLSHYTDYKDCKMKLHVSNVVDETMHYLNIPKNKRYEITQLAYKLRKKVYNLIGRNIELTEIAKTLTRYKKPKELVRKSDNSGYNSDLQKKRNEIFGN